MSNHDDNYSGVVRHDTNEPHNQQISIVVGLVARLVLSDEMFAAQLKQLLGGGESLRFKVRNLLTMLALKILPFQKTSLIHL